MHTAQPTQLRHPRRVLLFYALIVTALLAWGVFSIYPRARLDPAHPELHMTDFTVFTTAASALLDGHDAYVVTSPRGWPYFYPPLFALLVSPLRNLDPPMQAFIWFLINTTLAFGCLVECRRLGRALWMMRPTNAAHQSSQPPAWIGILAFLAALLPMLDCLQAGQVGHIVLYPLLLGLRLILLATSWQPVFLGGLLLALPVAIKLTPILPVGLLALLLICSGPRRSAPAAVLGLAIGTALCWLIIPATVLGWRANGQHLQRWYHHVVRDESLGRSRGINALSARNQCLGTALYRAANGWPHPHASLRQRNDPQARPIQAFPPRTASGWYEPSAIARTALLLLLLAAGLRLARASDRLGISAAVGLACIASLLISPISWGHHYVLLLPGTLFAAAWFYVHGWLKWSVVLACTPLTLVLLHYAALDHAGRFGLLAFGLTAWFLLACVSALTARFTPPRTPAGKTSTD